MNNKLVHSLFSKLEKDFCSVCSGVDTFMGSILDWADELLKTVEKEFMGAKESKESPSFLLPKTPSEKKTHNRKARNALVSKCSVFNSTIDYSENSCLNDTVSTRTRAGRRAATSKLSHLQVPQDKPELFIEPKKEKRSTENELSEVTFVVPQTTTSTRTKPVLKSKNLELPLPAHPSPASRASRSKIYIDNNESPEKRQSVRKRTLSGSPVDAQSKENILSETPASGYPIKTRISETPTANSEERYSRKKARTLSGSPPIRESRRKISRTLSKSPALRHSRKPPRTLSESPKERQSRRLMSKSESPLNRESKQKFSRSLEAENEFSEDTVHSIIMHPTVKALRTYSKNSSVRSASQKGEIEKGKNESLMVNRTVTIKKEVSSKISSTFIVDHEEEADDLTNEGDRTPNINDGRFTRISKTSTPMVYKSKPPAIQIETVLPDEIEEEAEVNADPSTNATYSVNESEENSQPKKKRKLKKEEETYKENIEDVAGTVRITRTKSKAIKQMMEENDSKQGDLTEIAKKLLNRAKMTSLKKKQLTAVLENNFGTPKNGPAGNNPFGTLTTKSKYHLLHSSSKLKTPLATLPNSAIKLPKPSSEKSKIAKRDSSIENNIRSVTKPPKDGALEREIKLKSKKEKEKEAALKREEVMKKKQEELKRKNELKHQLALKQREKLEQEKYNNMIQSEKEKEERHKIILQERQMKLKEEAIKKKMITQQKIIETNERRRLEEEARIAKLKEMEAEEQRLALEKQREQEKQEKRAQERLAQKKAREEYELQLKQELEAERLKAEKMSAKKYLMSASKMQSASKRPKFGMMGEKKEWDYKPRNEDDYGLEDEHSDVDSEDERNYDKSRPPVIWAKKILAGKGPYVRLLTLEMMCEYLPCYRKTPDINKMFKMTPSKRIKRTSSAIWNTPSS